MWDLGSKAYFTPPEPQFLHLYAQRIVIRIKWGKVSHKHFSLPSLFSVIILYHFSSGSHHGSWNLACLHESPFIFSHVL